MKNKHLTLYSAVPQVSGCQQTCNDCCGIVPLTPYEAKQLGIPKAKFTPVSFDGTCIFSKAGGCSVYDKRPFLCRIFGASKDAMLTCPKKASAKVPLSAKETRRLTDKYRKLAK